MLCFSLIPRSPRSRLFPYTTLFRSAPTSQGLSRTSSDLKWDANREIQRAHSGGFLRLAAGHQVAIGRAPGLDRKSTRLNSSHVAISYAVFCLKKKKTVEQRTSMLVE